MENNYYNMQNNNANGGWLLLNHFSNRWKKSQTISTIEYIKSLKTQI